MPAGGTAAFPEGVVHTWWNAGDDPVELSGHAIPAADLDRYLQAVFAVLNASASGRPSLFYIAHIALRHRRTQRFMTPTLAIQADRFSAGSPRRIPPWQIPRRFVARLPQICSGAPEVVAADLSVSLSLSADPSPGSELIVVDDRK